MDTFLSDLKINLNSIINIFVVIIQAYVMLWICYLHSIHIFVTKKNWRIFFILQKDLEICSYLTARKSIYLRALTNFCI